MGIIMSILMKELSTFDKILNVGVPAIVIFLFIAIMYRKLKEPIDSFAGLLKRLFTRGKDKAKDKYEEYRQEDDWGYIPK